MKKILFAVLAILLYCSTQPAYSGGGFFGGYTVPSTSMTQITRTLVPLTAAGQTTIYTVPAGHTLLVYDTFIEGQTTISGAVKTATLKVGTTANSYNELCNGVTGVVFATATGTSLLAVGSGFGCQELFLPVNASVAQVRNFAAGTIIQASVSGASLPTAGAVYVELTGIIQ